MKNFIEKYFSERENKTDMTKYYALFIIVVFTSFLGFLVENIWLILTLGVVDNRGMLFPFLLGYGFAVMAIYFLLGTPNEPSRILKRTSTLKGWQRRLIYYFAVMVLISIGEGAFGMLVEYFCGFIWWDYTNLPLNIGRYVSIPTSAAFSLIILVFMDRIFTPMYNKCKALNPKTLKRITIVFSVMFIVDNIYSAVYMLKNSSTVKRWEIRLVKNAIFHKLLK
ncbi:MAG: putative ABC transporter permease [Clostridia bacterium]|nr:putative ABC transporter permease [Clostridia bacterium]